MNSLEKQQSNLLLRKIKSDLAHGYKVLGNEANQIDIARVWCHAENAVKTFAIVATSGMRFHNPTSFLEVQSFGESNNFKVSFLLMDEQLVEVSTEQTTPGNTFSIEEFVNGFLQASPDNELTLKRLAAEGHNPKDLVRFSA